MTPPDRNIPLEEDYQRFLNRMQQQVHSTRDQKMSRIYRAPRQPAKPIVHMDFAELEARILAAMEKNDE